MFNNTMGPPAWSVKQANFRGAVGLPHRTLASHRFDIRDDRVQPAGAGGLRADDFGDLELTFHIGGPHRDLILARLWRTPGEQ